jgi:ATP-dependent helicase HrpA
LPIEPVSQASANQRAGRCGRLGPGTCVRLYSESDFDSRPEFTEPEILRTSLASVILRMLTMGLGSVEEFPFVDRPAPRMINDAYQLLFELSAIDKRRAVTDTGRALARWPLDVRLARMVEEGARTGCLEDIMVLAAALSIQDPRERPLDAQAAADEMHRRFTDDKSDFTTLLKLWQYLRNKRKEVSGNQFRKLCRREFLNWQRVLEWFDIYQQLRDQAREDRRKLSGRHGDYDQVHQSLMAGLLSHCGRKHPEDPGYTGARSSAYHIFPGSGLFGSSPKWLMSAEIVETSRPYARTNAVIKPEWIEQQGGHLLKHHYFDPHWSRRRGAVLPGSRSLCTAWSLSRSAGFNTGRSTRRRLAVSLSWKRWSGERWTPVRHSRRTMKKSGPKWKCWNTSAAEEMSWSMNRPSMISSTRGFRKR